VGADELAEQLRAIAEELGELALDRLRRAAEDAGAGGPDPQVLAEERRLSRARRAVEKAAALLEGPGR
jgi:hypothetical protein